ncbi:MAG: sensor histidine kinase [Bacteroidetes bacterium]|nr:sensor histidine kinase [Bacteroidota bacterium]
MQDNLNDNNSDRVKEILDVIMSYARFDFSKKTVVRGNDTLDAIGAGVNMLGEELESSTVSLKEKEQLLKEIHHRVKNNLQIVSSLLNLQSENILDKRYLDLIIESRNRINSMALVHEMLYSSKDLSKIEMGEYVQRLSIGIQSSLLKNDANIKFHYNLQHDLYFDIDHMIPLGLILNEIISNSYKYAFPENTGRIDIEMSKTDKHYLLVVKDNGIGLKPNFDVKRDSNLGMQLIYMLTEQLDGKVGLDSVLGVAYEITFPL